MELDKTVANLVTYDKEIKEVVVRTGEALPVANLLNVHIEGNINAPLSYVENRPTTPQDSICYFSKSDGTIELHINEDQPYGKYVIKGVIKVSKKFISIGINNVDKTMNPKQLANKLKMLRRLFPSKEEHMKICTILNNFEATVKRVMEDGQNDRGDYHSLRNQAVSSNIPESFKMVLPIIEGEPSTEITINTIITADKNDIICSLESVDAAEYIEDLFDTRIDVEIEKLRTFTTLISK